MKKALISLIGGQNFEVEFEHSRDFVNGLRTSIQNKALYEFFIDDRRIFVNTGNITSVEMIREVIPGLNLEVFRTATENIREMQLKMQPDILKFEAKAAAMQELKDIEDKRKNLIGSIYGRTETETDKNDKTDKVKEKVENKKVKNS